MQAQIRALVDITYDHAREVTDSHMAGAISLAVDYMNSAGLLNLPDSDGNIVAIPVFVTLSIGTVYPGGATMKVGNTIVIKDIRERIEE